MTVSKEGNFNDALAQKSHESKQNETTCITCGQVFLCFSFHCQLTSPQVT